MLYLYRLHSLLSFFLYSSADHPDLHSFPTRRSSDLAEPELDAFVDQLGEAPLDDVLFDLEVRHAEPEQASACLVSLEHRDRVAGAVQLLRAGETRRPGADDGDRLPGAAARRLRGDPALLPGARDDCELDLLDRDRVRLLDLEHARRLARRGAEAPGELREVVRAMQLPDRLVPAVAIDEVVPVRDEISQRAAVMAERHAALHATRALLAQLDEGQRTDELEVVADPLRGRPLRRLGTRELLEAADFAHQAASSDSDSRVKRPWPPAETG